MTSWKCKVNNQSQIFLLSSSGNRNGLEFTRRGPRGITYNVLMCLKSPWPAAVLSHVWVKGMLAQIFQHKQCRGEMVTARIESDIRSLYFASCGSLSKRLCCNDDKLFGVAGRWQELHSKNKCLASKPKDKFFDFHMHPKRYILI